MGSTKRAIALGTGSVFAIALAWSEPSMAQASRDNLPIPPAPYEGEIGHTMLDSKAYFPPEAHAPTGAPNILLIMTDDVGFGASSVFGGPIPTAALEALAAQGVRYNRFHTTAIRSPSRAALLTGRNSHSVGAGLFPEFITGYPGYDGVLPKSAATIAEVLRQNGYSTSMFGKNHNTPDDEKGPTGPFDRWPTGLGFEYFYGFNGYDSNQYSPLLYENTTEIPSPTDPDYHLDADLAGHAAHWIRVEKAMTPDKPFFLYYAPGAAHAPHQAPADWIAKFRGKFDYGWDVQREQTFARQKELGVIPKNTILTPRPASIPAWSSLTIEQQRTYAHLMEVYAAMLAYSDSQIARIFDAIDGTGQRANTLIFFIEGDNGASAEGTLRGTAREGAETVGVEETDHYMTSMYDKMGGPMTYEHYPVGWAWAMNAPMQWTKQVASHFGGTRNGLVVSWPDQIQPDAKIRSQFSHLVDIYPTILEAAHLPAPKSVNGVGQQPLAGVSMEYSFNSPEAPGRHHVQYFEMIGNRGIYKDGWFANTVPRRLPWILATRPEGDPERDYKWELYDLNSDFSQGNNLAARYPAKLAEMKALWTEEAEKNHVFPLDDSFIDRYAINGFPPSFNGDRKLFRYPADMPRVPNSVAPDFARHSFSISTTFQNSNGILPNGVIAAVGGRFGGWTFYVLDGKPVLVEALSQQPRDKFRIAATTALPAGSVNLRYDVDYDEAKAGGGATVAIFVNDRQVATGHFPHKLWAIGGAGNESFDIAKDAGTPVSDDYSSPFPFNGMLSDVTVRLK